MDFYSEGLMCFCLPDTACRKLSGRNPLDMDSSECRFGYEACEGNCIYYTEDAAYLRNQESEGAESSCL